MDYSLLFTPAEFSNFNVKNRLVMAPMTTISGDEDGSFSSEEIKYLSQRAEDGIGIIISPACYCHKSGHAFERQVGCDRDDLLGSLSKTAEAINRHGAASFLQIHHGGNAAKEKFTGQKPLAPSACINRAGTSELPREITEDEIRMIIDSFAQAAGRAKKAGFTGIELHGANTYLFQQFFSPFTNKRSDKWGGDINIPGKERFENRARFACEVVKAARSEVGEYYPISYRISPEEAEPDGYSVNDTIEFLNTIVPLGIDIIHVSSWDYHKSLRNDIPLETNPTKLIKKAFPNIPVIGVGGIMLPDQAVQVLNDGIDLVALGKVLMLEKDWVKKVKSGDITSIRTKINSEEERQNLNIPERMKNYSKRFFIID
ncbi:MAG: NADH-dependent flavin oxidoreductase [Ignavibacteria bacterium]|jgi:2,4-dienoyl-CoA reductase-like NADH-dependent reductase (Old Yellow Enzyme family)